MPRRPAVPRNVFEANRFKGDPPGILHVRLEKVLPVEVGRRLAKLIRKADPQVIISGAELVEKK